MRSIATPARAFVFPVRDKLTCLQQALEKVFMKQAVALVAAKRTPIGKFMGVFSDMSAVDLGEAAARAALKQAGLAPSDIDETVMGHARQAGGGPNGARQVSVRSEIPVDRPAWTINQACASGLQALWTGAQRILLGEAETVLAGGMESMTQVPYLLRGARMGYRLGHNKLVDGMYQDGFGCPLAGQVMGETAETLADQYEITREEQDAFAARSQNRAETARKEGRFDEEIAPVTVRTRKGEILVSEDEHPRDGVTADSLSGLPSVFRKDGTVSPGNSSGITDGAAAVVLMSAAQVEKRGLEPLAWIEGAASAGVDPSIMGIGPVPAVARLQRRIPRPVRDYDLVELNEAFAAQVIACDRELQFDQDRLNVNGGAIALGHPIGATGARIVVTLLHEMIKRKGEAGLATLCVSGGMGMAMSLVRKP